MNSKKFDIEEYHKISDHVKYFNKKFATITSEKIPVMKKLNEIYTKKITEHFITLVKQDHQPTPLVRENWFSQSKNIVDTTTDLIRDKYVSYCINNIDNLKNDSDPKIIIDIIDNDLKDIDAKLNSHLKLDSNE